MSVQSTHTRLLVNNFEACFRFYFDVMGFEYRAGDDTGPYVEFLIGSGVLGMFRRDYMAHTVHRSEKSATIDAQDTVVLVFEVEDVDAMMQKIKVSGVKAVNEPMDMPEWVLRVAHFRDPDGNLIEINQPLKTI